MPCSAMRDGIKTCLNLEKIEHGLKFLNDLIKYPSDFGMGCRRKDTIKLRDPHRGVTAELPRFVGVRSVVICFQGFTIG